MVATDRQPGRSAAHPLYLRGVSAGDFQEALAALLGKDAPNLSPSVIARLKAEWEVEYARWQRRELRTRSALSQDTARLMVFKLIRRAVPAFDPRQIEMALWDSVKDSKDPAELQEYLQQYPNGSFAGLARSRIAAFKAAQATPSSSNFTAQAAPAAPQRLAVVTPALPVPSSPPRVGQSFRDCADCPEMVVVPAGAFMMGYKSWSEAQPVHRVAVAQAFALGKYPVMRGEYARFAQATGRGAALAPDFRVARTQ